MVDQSKLFIHFGVMTPLGALSTMMVALRFYTRLAITRMHLAADDYLILVAMFLSNASSIMVAVADFAFDEGQALGNSPSDIQKKIGMRKIHWVATQIYPLMSFTLKISILLLYRRIFFVVPTFTRVCNVLIILISALHLAGFSSGIFLCVPISFFWEQVLPPGAPGAPTHKGRCQNYQVAWLVLGSFNVLTDLITVVLPLPVIGRLKITPQRRAFLVFIFALSSVPVIASLLRIRPLVRIPGGNDDPLFSQHVWELQLYCGIEISVGITCACLPTLTPLAVRLFPNLMGSQGGNGSEPVGPIGAALGGLGWLGAKVLNGKRASGDAAMHAESRGEDFDPVTTIGGTSAKLPGFKTGRKGSVGKGRFGRKRSDSDASIMTITADDTMATKMTATVAPVDDGKDDVDEQRLVTPPSPTSKQDVHHGGHKNNKSKKKNALGLRLATDSKSWTSKVATALTRQQQHPTPPQQQQKSKTWRLSPIPLPSPSFSLNLMLSPKTTSTPQRHEAWAARLGEVVAAPLHGNEAEAAIEERDGSCANADASTVASTEPGIETDGNWDDRARPRARTSERRRRSSRSLDWQAASSARESAELRRSAAAATAAACTRRASAVSRDQGVQEEREERQVEWWKHQQRRKIHPHPHPHPLHSNPQNPPAMLSSPTSPTPSLPSPSIYSRASVITTHTRRPSDTDLSSSSYHFRRRPSASDSVLTNHLRRRPSAADAYATIVEDDNDAEWPPARIDEDEDEAEWPCSRVDDVRAESRQGDHGAADDAADDGAAWREKWWLALRKASISSATIRRDEGQEGDDASARRSSVASELRRRPMSWTADLGV